MKNNIIKEIWEIKRTIDKAIDLQDMWLFKTAQERFQFLYVNKEYLKSIATSTIDYEPSSVEDMAQDREQNFAVIAVELNKDKQRAEGYDVPIVKFQFSSIFELMWWNCWMFNNMKKHAELGCPVATNLKIYLSIEANMNEIIKYYDNFEDEISKREQQTCIEIYELLKDTINELYPEVTI
ncbi:MAG: hypothetical protein J6Q13_02845 [Clostridia bacterium]|nr:hypothetical protein [Clostridia bacterium]